MNEFGKVIDNASIRDYTTYKLSGKINKVVYPENLEKLVCLLKFLNDNNIKYMVIGYGSNLIFTKDYDGVIIKLDNFNDIVFDDNLVTVSAGYSLIKFSLDVAKKGLSGLEFASAIPGTVGGAVYMNAGAYNASISDVIKKVLVLDEDLNLKWLSLDNLKFGYRDSILKKKNYLCLKAIFELKYSDCDSIMKVIKARKQRRLETQPLNFPSAGSVFRNPLNDFAGRLIENANLKGKKIGDAMVSFKHANFIINTGSASGEDVKKLIDYIKKEVKKKYNVELILEQEIVE